jgi:hypothetical protein
MAPRVYLLSAPKPGDSLADRLVFDLTSRGNRDILKVSQDAPTDIFYRMHNPAVVDQLIETLQRARRALHTLGDEHTKEICAEALAAAGVEPRLFEQEVQERDIAELTAGLRRSHPD